MDKLNKSLPQIIRESSELEALLWESGGEITPEIQDVYNRYLISKGTELPEKVEGVIQFRDRLENTAGLLKSQAEELTKKAKSLKNIVSAMDFNILEAVRFAGGKLETTSKKLSIRKSESVQVEDVNLIPPEFIDKKITLAAKKTDIKKAIKAGQLVPGAFIEERENLNIR